MIAIGGTVYLIMDNPIIGSVLFAIGLFSICNMRLKLYTGAAGFMGTDMGLNGWQMFGCLIFNFLGTLAISALISISRIFPELEEKAKAIVDVKMNDSYASLFALAVMCGILMYVGVYIFETMITDTDSIAIIFAVVVFILCGYEHSIADMFYFNVAKAYSLEMLVRLLIIVLGNTIGSITVGMFHRYTLKSDKDFVMVHTQLDENGNLIISDDNTPEAKEFLNDHPDAVKTFKEFVENSVKNHDDNEDSK